MKSGISAEFCGIAKNRTTQSHKLNFFAVAVLVAE
jgi:hypothetical protein